MKKTTKKWIATVSAVILAILIAVITYGSFYLVDYALTSKPQSHKKNWGKAFAWYPELRPWLDSIRAERAWSDTFAIMPDGTRAHAVLIRSTKANGRTAVVVHGYTNNSIDMLHIARIYNKEMHYNIMLPDLHGHGLTGGNDIQMGWKDRIDVLKWIEMAPKTVGISADSMRIVVHGISMGAATTMCVSGEKTPKYVRCFVEDCGYTSAWDEFKHELHGRYSLPAFPLLYTASWLTKAKYGWSFKEASPLKQVAKCTKPMLFIHGDKDTFVPTWMVYPLYETKPHPKKLWIAPGSGHAFAYRDHRKEYIKKVEEFVNQYNTPLYCRTSE